jgi:hypothetical protein
MSCLRLGVTSSAPLPTSGSLESHRRKSTLELEQRAFGEKENNCQNITRKGISLPSLPTIAQMSGQLPFVDQIRADTIYRAILSETEKGQSRPEVPGIERGKV